MTTTTTRHSTHNACRPRKRGSKTSSKTLCFSRSKEGVLRIHHKGYKGHHCRRPPRPHSLGRKRQTQTSKNAH